MPQQSGLVIHSRVKLYCVYTLLIFLLSPLQMPHGVVTARPWLQSTPRPLACWRPRDQRSAWVRWTPPRRLNWPKSMVCEDIPPSSSSRVATRSLPKSILVGVFQSHRHYCLRELDYENFWKCNLMHLCFGFSLFLPNYITWLFAGSGFLLILCTVMKVSFWGVFSYLIFFFFFFTNWCNLE